MARTVREETQAKLRKKYHTLCSKLGLTSDDKSNILFQYGVISSTALEVEQLIEICENLQNTLNPKQSELDQMRKKVIASIGGWFDLIYGAIDRKDSEAKARRIDLIKSTACRQTGHRSFNKIPLERLRNVYNLFLNKQKDFKRNPVEEVDIYKFSMN